MNKEKSKYYETKDICEVNEKYLIIDSNCLNKVTKHVDSIVRLQDSSMILKDCEYLLNSIKADYEKICADKSFSDYYNYMRSGIGDTFIKFYFDKAKQNLINIKNNIPIPRQDIYEAFPNNQELFNFNQFQLYTSYLLRKECMVKNSEAWFIEDFYFKPSMGLNNEVIAKSINLPKIPNYKSFDFNEKLLYFGTNKKWSLINTDGLKESLKTDFKLTTSDSFFIDAIIKTSSKEKIYYNSKWE